MRPFVTSILFLSLCPFAPAQIQEPLDNATLSRLTLSLSNNIQLQPGQTYQFSLSVIECCYVPKPVNAQVTWSIEPSGGAHIDPQTGLLSVGRSTTNGSVFTVTADVENGRRNLSIKVYVYTPEANPLVGVWRERARLKCDSKRRLTPLTPIGELEFRADNTFSVTWTPFEVYRDYVGSYSYDLRTGRIKLVVAGGNYVPANIDGEGTFTIDVDRNLILKDVWLGSRSGEQRASICASVFSRP